MFRAIFVYIMGYLGWPWTNWFSMMKPCSSVRWLVKLIALMVTSKCIISNTCIRGTTNTYFPRKKLSISGHFLLYLTTQNVAISLNTAYAVSRSVCDLFIPVLIRTCLILFCTSLFMSYHNLLRWVSFDQSICLVNFTVHSLLGLQYLTIFCCLMFIPQKYVIEQHK